jgi:glutamate synthase domain-containing protein 3
MNISARDLGFKELNKRIKKSAEDIYISDCCGQRFIGSGLKDKTLTIQGTPGNALGAYLNGARIEVHGNVQDAVGDTMNDGRIVVHGSAGDALGYAMRGGRIFVRGDAGYRTGIHMKEYKDKKPVIIIGGKVGSFLGEYLAGGLIVVLGLHETGEPAVNNFTGAGMHGGRIFIRTNKELTRLPAQVVAEVASAEDMREIAQPLTEYAACFGMDAESLMRDRFYVLMPNEKNPYTQLYTPN